VSVLVVTAHTTAQIQGGATVTGGGAVSVTANDDSNQINLTGAFQTSQQTSIGVSAAVNVLDRNTLAIIGDLENSPTATNPPTGASTYGSSTTPLGEITLSATETGNLITSAIAGSVVSDAPPIAGSSLGNLLGGTPGTGTLAAAGEGIGASGAGSLNLLTSDNVEAYINDRGTFHVGHVSVTANNASQIVSATGAAAVTLTERPSSGLAGAVSVNTINGATRAFIDGATLTADGLTLSAERSGFTFALTAGVAVSEAPTPEENAFDLAVAVAVNTITDDTEAFLRDANATLAGAALIAARNDDQIWAIDGSATYGAGVGLGAAVGVDVISDNADADIVDSAINQSAGGLTVSATTANSGAAPGRIIAVTASFGVSTTSTALTGTISINRVADGTNAYLSGTTYTNTAAGQSATVTATDSSGIVSLAGAVGVGGRTSTEEFAVGALGVAGAFDFINDTTKAYLDDSKATLSGDLSITAGSTSVIGSLAAGVAVAQETALAGSLSINQITDTIDAHIGADSWVMSGAAVSLSATDKSLIVAIAGGGALGNSGKAGGASIGYNRIANTITADIAGATVRAHGSVNLSALSSPLLVAVTAEGAGSAGTSAGTGTLTMNFIANTVDAHIVGSTVTAAAGDVAVNSSEAASEYVVALGVAASLSSSSVGAAIALNFLGGQAPLDPTLLDTNLLSYNDGPLASSTTVGVTSDAPTPVDTEIDLPNHGFTTGDAVVYHDGGATPIGGLVDGQTYYIIAVDANHIHLASSAADAQAGTAIPISSTGSTTSNQTFTLTRLQSTPALTFNPTNSSISHNEIYLFSVTQANGTLIVNFNVPLPAAVSNIQGDRSQC
jgi:hypothetical protein